MRGRLVHPSLPPNPQLHHTGGGSQTAYGDTQNQPPNVGALAAHALTSSLVNPYGHANNQYSYTNANYHAYFTQMHPMTTAQGYTFSSTYVPQPEGTSAQAHSHSWPQSQRGRATNRHATSNAPRSFVGNSFSSPGDTRCTHEGCSFAGSKKTVEIHMMDRHLIFPPGWKKRRDDWDADPSLKGKPVPIPGTGVMLNTPEAIDAWLAERRKKWPSSQHVKDKKRKAQEAADRGEIDPSELTGKGRKKRRVDGVREHESRGRGRGRARGRGRGEWKGGTTDSGWRGRGRGRGVALSGSELVPGETNAEGHRGGVASVSSDDSSSSEDSNSDMDPVKDALSSKIPNPTADPRILRENLGDGGQQIHHEHNNPTVNQRDASNKDLSSNASRPFRQRKPAPPPPPNPFTIRPSLLRNLLLPEIRHTVSNLSQAIHFLVENDFLEDVELNPGDANSQRIKVLESDPRSSEGEYQLDYLRGGSVAHMPSQMTEGVQESLNHTACP